MGVSFKRQLKMHFSVFAFLKMAASLKVKLKADYLETSINEVLS